jgi:non-homologous end joining protein Ku
MAVRRTGFRFFRWHLAFFSLAKYSQSGEIISRSQVVGPARGRVIDLMTALKESFKTIERGKKKADQKKRRKA